MLTFHRSRDEPVLKGVSIEVRAGEHIAICGRTGGGKTSLLLCLLRMIEMKDGRVDIDGFDISPLRGGDLRSRINVVPQDPLLLPGTVRFNIDPSETASEDDIIRALTHVRLWNTVCELGGLNQIIDTEAWSAGQRQLLCLARAIVRKSKILLLDEATSRYGHTRFD